MDAVNRSRYSVPFLNNRANGSPCLTPFRQVVELSHAAPRHFDGIGIGPRRIARVRTHSLLSLLKRLLPLRPLPRLHVVILNTVSLWRITNTRPA
jgi:hypothetical protein